MSVSNLLRLPADAVPGNKETSPAGAGHGAATPPPRHQQRATAVRRSGQRRPLWARLVVGLALLATIIPLAYLVSVSLMGRDETVSGILFSATPKFSNWNDVLLDSELPRSILNSLVAAVGGALLSLGFGLPGAWAIVRYRTGGKPLASMVTSPWLLPPVVAVIPLFMLLRVLGLNDTLLGLTLVYALVNLPVAIWLLEGFLRKLPEEIFEAAALDGAGLWRIFGQLVVPLMWPALVAVGTIAVILNYNEFLLATFLTQSPEAQTAPVALSLFYGERTPHFGKIAAASVIAVIPVFALATFFQRWMVEGLTSGVGK